MVLGEWCGIQTQCMQKIAQTHCSGFSKVRFRGTLHHHPAAMAAGRHQLHPPDDVFGWLGMMTDDGG